MSVSRSKSRLGNAVKRARAKGVPPDRDPAVRHARQDLKADKLAAYIEATVASAPPLRPDQVDALGRLFQQRTAFDLPPATTADRSSASPGPARNEGTRQ